MKTFATALFCLLMTGCASSPMNPMTWFSSDSGGDGEGEPDGPLETAETLLDMFLRFGWFLIILLFLIPGVKTPVLALFTAIFRVMTIPFEWVRLQYDAYKERKRWK